MKLSFKKMTATGLLTLASMSVNAVLIDNGTFTTDTVSGLDWLDVTESAFESYNTVSAQFGVGGRYYGWRYATGAQFNQLVSNEAGVDITGYNLTSLVEVNFISAADRLTSLLGSTLDSAYGLNGSWDSTNGYAEGDGYDYTYGITADAQDDGHFLAIIIDYDVVGSSAGTGSGLVTTGDSVASRNHFMRNHVSNNSVGSFLIRDTIISVSEPATLALLGLGIACLGFTRRQKKA